MRALAPCVLALSGCGDFHECPLEDPEQLASLPASLSQTGLDGADVIAYEPRFELWSDGATKRRWIRVPPNERIDTSDPDAWAFPAGTRLWKEFTRDGVRVETRMLERRPEGNWLAIAYVWDGTDAFPRADGVEDALGTAHDVPAADQCFGCHGGRRSGVLGFSAIQLPTDQLDAIAARGVIDPIEPITIPGTEAESAALGYLHANCSHCHNQDRPPRGESRCYDPEKDFDLSLRVGDLGSVKTTAAYRTAIGEIVERGKPSSSEMIERVKSGHMPPLGHELVDQQGLALLTAWIKGL